MKNAKKKAHSKLESEGFLFNLNHSKAITARVQSRALHAGPWKIKIQKRHEFCKSLTEILEKHLMPPAGIDITAYALVESRPPDPVHVIIRGNPNVYKASHIFFFLRQRVLNYKYIFQPINLKKLKKKTTHQTLFGIISFYQSWPILSYAYTSLRLWKVQNS